MKPIKFPESNTAFGANQNQPENIPLYCYYPRNEKTDAAISCWKLSFWERVAVLFTGKIWLEVLLFFKPPPPVKLWAKNPFIKQEGEE